MESMVDENGLEAFFESNTDLMHEFTEFDEIDFKEQERWRGFDIVLDTLNLQSQVLHELLKIDWQSAWHLLGAAKELERIFSERLDSIESQMNIKVNHD